DAADEKFANVIEPALMENFLSYGANNLECIKRIEKDIKSYLLDEIVKYCNTPGNTLINAVALRQLIETHREKLIEGTDPEIMTTMRGLAISNEYPAVIAWRGYDAQAPCIQWENLLTSNDEAGILVRQR